MPNVSRPSGIVVFHPSSVDISDTPDTSPPSVRGGGTRDRTRRRRDGRDDVRPTATGEAGDDETAALIAALAEQELDLVDSFEVAPPESARTRGGTRGGVGEIAAGETVEVAVPLEEGEDAVVLVEQDGEYRWQLPTAASTAAAATRTRGGAARGRRRGGARDAGTRTVTFAITVRATPAVAPTDERTRGGTRGLIKKFVVGKLTAFVLKFGAKIAGKAATGIMKKLESNVRPGLVRMDSDDPMKWALLGPDDALGLPTDRPADVLLFIHGTFSSSIGSYGALAHTEEGRALLQAVRQRYDLVVGFDHYTLSETPEQNATAIMARLKRASWPHPPRIDAVAYSRGGLVFRTLVEQVIPKQRWNAQFGRAVFVGCTNGGTELAEPENWNKLADLYTNIAVAACRGISLIPQATAFATVMAEVIKGIGAFVKYLASYIVDGDGVPGIAAMEPDGEVVTTLNRLTPGSSGLVLPHYCAVTGDFDPGLASGDGAVAAELPPSLLMKLADGLVDRLMGEDNDLVVNTASMTMLNPAARLTIDECHALGAQGQTYHTTYFRRRDVIEKLDEWLMADFPEVEQPLRGARRGGGKQTTKTAGGTRRSSSVAKRSAARSARRGATRRAARRSSSVREDRR